MTNENSGTLMNDGREPVIIRAPSGRITWRQLRGNFAMKEDGSLSIVLTDSENFDESEHDFLTLHVGGMAQYFNESGKFIVFGNGLSASPPLPSG